MYSCPCIVFNLLLTLSNKENASLFLKKSWVISSQIRCSPLTPPLVPSHPYNSFQKRSNFRKYLFPPTLPAVLSITNEKSINHYSYFGLQIHFTFDGIKCIVYYTCNYAFSRPNHIEILVLSILFFLSVRSLKINTFFKNMVTLGHRWNIKISQLNFRFV